jgi:MoxR-like ATPase
LDVLKDNNNRFNEEFKVLKTMEFKNFETLIKKIEEDLGSEFNQTFRQERKKLAGLKNLPNQIIFSEFDKDKSEWVYNRGGKKEIQYHIYLRNNELGYGLGINSQRGSFNNDDPKVIANSFGNSFKEIYSEIKKKLPTYIFKIGSEDMLGRMNEEEFILFGKSIPYNNDNKLSDLDYKELIKDLKKQLDVYIMVFELNVLKKDKSLSREKQMIERQQILEYKKQIILQGPPGTGKTREAKLISKKMLGLNDGDDLKDNDQFKLIQFHPSYTYEDFVRGIVAESKGDRIEYKNVNKILADFAEKALKNFKDSKKVPELISKEIWVEAHYLKFKEHLESELGKSGQLLIKKDTKPKITAVEENAVRVNRYSNEDDSVLIKDSDIINGYIGLHLSNTLVKVKDNLILSKSARSGMYYLYQNLIEKFNQYLKNAKLIYKTGENSEPIKLRKYVLVIDEINRANLSSVLGELIYALEYRGEEVESMYTVEEDNKLILPPNLYIIGTMNTSDRSVGHIDYAIRRRFAFVDVLPKELNDDPKVKFHRDLFKAVSELFIEQFDPSIDYAKEPYKLKRSNYLSNEFEPKDIWLGHSYFIDKSDELDGVSMDIRFDYEIKPILLEYVKDGILIGKDINNKIEGLKDYL